MEWRTHSDSEESDGEEWMGQMVLVEEVDPELLPDGGVPMQQPQPHQDSNADDADEEIVEFDRNLPATHSVLLVERFVPRPPLADPSISPSSEEAEEEEDEGEQVIEEFDRNLPASHSYLPGAPVAVRDRSFLEPGWQGELPCLAHHSVVFPGETFPMMCHGSNQTDMLREIGHVKKLFGVLCPDVTGHHVTRYGVLCEVLEVLERPVGRGHMLARNLLDMRSANVFSFKAQAKQRFRLVDPHKIRVQLNPFKYIANFNVKILHDVATRDSLGDVRLLSIGKYRSSPRSSLNKRNRNADSVVTPWPHFVYDRFDVEELVTKIKEYFRKLMIERLPEELVSLSYWVATNLSMTLKDRITLFTLDNALLRLYLELHLIDKVRSLCCNSCMKNICCIDNIFPMSIEGLHANYCNIGGYIHDIFTVRSVENVELEGLPSIEFTWFPGYLWTIAVCSGCGTHVGWKFTASKKSLRPESFWGLSRKSLVPEKLTTDLDQEELQQLLAPHD